MADSIAKQISFFRIQINKRRFDELSLRILDSILVTRDVKSSMEVRSSLKEFLRTESMSVLREIVEKSIDQKLSVLGFFVRAFAVIGDIESCLALRYEALTLRSLKSPSSPLLSVSTTEWLTFAEQSVGNGFFAVGRKACENSLLCLQRKETTELTSDELSKQIKLAAKIKSLEDSAVTSAASHAVQAQAVMYLRSKTTGKCKTQPSFSQTVSKSTGSILFRNGIKKRNERMLQERKNIQITVRSRSVEK